MLNTHLTEAGTWCNGAPLTFFGRNVGSLRCPMTMESAIATWDPFQNPSERQYGNTRNFRARIINLLLRINGY